MFNQGLVGLTDDANVLASRQLNDPNAVWSSISKSGAAAAFRAARRGVRCVAPKQSFQAIAIFSPFSRLAGNTSGWRRFGRAGPGRLRAGGRPLRPRLQPPPGRPDTARARTPANAAGAVAQEGTTGVQAAARRLSGAFPKTGRPGRRPTAEPAPKPWKTDVDAEMSALQAEPASFPQKNAFRKIPRKLAVRKNRHLFCWTRDRKRQFTRCATNRTFAHAAIADAENPPGCS